MAQIKNIIKIKKELDKLSKLCDIKLVKFT